MSYLLLYGEPDEVSPWMSDGAEEMHRHKAVCPYCRLPLEIKLLFEVKHACYGKQYVQNYEKRNSLIVFCRKGAHQRIEWEPPPPIRNWAKIDLSRRIAGTRVYSCGEVAIRTPNKRKGLRPLTQVLYDTPLTFSNCIWLMIENLKKGKVYEADT